jgi:hypothetical protein
MSLNFFFIINSIIYVDEVKWEILHNKKDQNSINKNIDFCNVCTMLFEIEN